MSSSPVVLRTDRQQALSHETIITIGEALKQQYEEEVEDKRQRTIRSVQEVVRREEEAKADKKLSMARSEWSRERQQLFKEAHESQLRAIARQNSLLESRLRQEFADTLQQVGQEHQEEIARVIDRTWTEAEAVKNKAVEKAREEEREIAREEALLEATKVAEMMRQHAQKADDDRESALAEQRELLAVEQNRALQRQKEELETEFKKEMARVSSQHEVRLSELCRKMEEQCEISHDLKGRLMAMTQLKEDWEMKYNNIRTEFSDFIDHVPGFRGEFVLK